MRGSGADNTGQAYPLIGASMTPTPEYRTIPLTQGKVTLVDASDYEWLSQRKWRALWQKSGYYAMRSTHPGVLAMHRVILDAPKGMQVDHINRDTLDNRRSNLRLATWAQNQANAKLGSRNTSGYKGVSWCKSMNCWIAQTTINGKGTRIGYFPSAEEGYVAYCAVVKKLHGEFSNPPKPPA